MKRGRPKKKSTPTPKVSASDDIIKTKGVLDESGKTVLKGVVTD